MTDPYAPPLSEVDPLHFPDSDAQATRARLIRHEGSLRSFGLLFLIGGVAGVIGGVLAAVAFVAQGLSDGGNAPDASALVGMALAYGLFSGGQLWTGLALRRLQAKARVPATMLSVVSLISIGIGTLLGLYLLWLIWSPKGREVLSPAYAEVMAATPEMKHQTSPLAWGALILLLLFMAAMVAVSIHF